MHNTTNDNGAPPPSIDSYVAPLVITAVGILFTVLMLSLFFFTFWWHYLKPHQSSPHANTNRLNLVKNSKGVPEEILKKIRIITYLSPPQENQQDDSGNSVQNECSICLGTFDNEEKLRVLPNCSHAFHVPCIDAWFEEHTNCPICRSPIDCDCDCESESPPLPPTDSAENSIQQRVFHVIQIDDDQSMDNEFQQMHSVLDRRHSHSDSCCHYMMKKPRSLGMRLKRSLSLDDQSSLYVSVTIQRDQQQEEASTSSSCSSSSSSSTSTTSNTKDVTVMNRYKSKSLKHHMSMVLMRSFSTCTSFSGILPN